MVNILERTTRGDLLAAKYSRMTHNSHAPHEEHRLSPLQREAIDADKVPIRRSRDESLPSAPDTNVE